MAASLTGTTGLTKGSNNSTVILLGSNTYSGATTINIPDTVGYTMPHEFTAYLERLYELVPGLRDVVLEEP